jgi:hypothetical protein
MLCSASSVRRRLASASVPNNSRIISQTLLLSILELLGTDALASLLLTLLALQSIGSGFLLHRELKRIKDEQDRIRQEELKKQLEELKTGVKGIDTEGTLQVVDTLSSGTDTVVQLVLLLLKLSQLHSAQAVGCQRDRP